MNGPVFLAVELFIYCACPPYQWSNMIKRLARCVAISCPKVWRTISMSKAKSVALYAENLYFDYEYIINSFNS